MSKPQPQPREQREQDALCLLRRIGRRPEFVRLFDRVLTERHRAARPGDAAIWADLEELLAIDLEKK